MAKVNKAWCAPPLPFAGNKKYWAGELYEQAALLPVGTTVWDVFGGAGVCARCVKDARPDLRVVYNDHDGYAQRCAHIVETESLRKQVSRIVGPRDAGASRLRVRLSAAQRDTVRDLFVEHEARYGYFDGLSVCRWLSIGAVDDPLRPQALPSALYANVPGLPLPVSRALSWCDGLELCHCDCRDLPIAEGDAVILDPPYVATDLSEYGGKDALDTLRFCRDVMRRCPFILFGDAMISFWYEVLTEPYFPRFFVKTDIISGMQGKRRAEVMYTNW